MNIRRKTGVLAMGLVLALGIVPAAARAETRTAFTPDRPENQGLSPAALDKAADELNRLVRDGLLVGGELLILKNRRVVMHQTAGWADRERGVRLEKNAIFSLKSMARPLVGLAAQILIDEGRLSLRDKVSRFLPAFGQGPAAAITVEHLLTQRSGLPKSGAPDFALAGSLFDLADSLAPDRLAFEPGSDFLAADSAADVLGAVIERAGGLGLEEFIRRRLLEPLGMSDTFVFTNPNDPRAGRICSSYVGAASNWNRNWSPADGPPYSFALGSQSYFSTPLDYARLLSLLLDQGRAGGRPVLTAAALKRILTPVSSIPSDTGFSGMKLRYGQMMQLLTEAAGANQGPTAFGHSSSEGILAWAWPASDLMVLFFTQTRGVRAEIPMETAVDAALIHPRDAAGVPEAYRTLLGKYLDVYGPSGLEEISVVFLSGRLAIDIPSQAMFFLDPPDAQGRFALSRNPSIRVAFIRNASGEVTALQRFQGDQTLEIPREGTAEAKALQQEVMKAREGWTKFLGQYTTEAPVQTVEIVRRGGSLGILRQGQSAPLLLRPPDPQGRWRLKANPKSYVTFEENDRGGVVSFTLHTADGQALVRTRTKSF